MKGYQIKSDEIVQLPKEEIEKRVKCIMDEMNRRKSLSPIRLDIPSGSFGSNGKKKKSSNVNKILMELIEICEKMDATVMSFRIADGEEFIPVAIVEDSIGRLSSFAYSKGEWR